MKAGMNMKKVLIVDDEFLIRFTLEEGLKDRGYETQSAETVKDALEKMKTFHPQVILLDNRLQDSLGIDEISTFRSADEEVQVILMTAYGSVAQAVEATKRGAYDYILKPFDIDEIDRIASRCIGQMQDRESLEFLKGKTQEFIGVSDAAMRIRRHIGLLGKNSTVNVLIRGETGTGKEVAASLIHACSDRRDHLMVRINCSAIPEHLMESELFGYERGAFAGAMKTKKGLIELAAGGTVFLDEIGELPLSMQTKILTFLDHKKFKCGWPGGHRSGCPGDRGDKPESGTRRKAGGIPGRPFLPDQCHGTCDPAVTGPERGHSGALRLLPEIL